MHKFLAEAGVASRRRSERLIASGRVMVNGKVADRPGTVIDDSRDVVEVDGIPVRRATERCAVVVYKPRGYLSSTGDRWGRPVVVDLVKGVGRRRLYPVGRLDLDSEGLMVLTDDGDLAQMLTHPRYQVEKEYLVDLNGVPSREALDRLRNGIEIGGTVTSPAKIDVVGMTGRGTRLMVTIREGKKRQIRKMFEAIGHRVIRLVRMRIGTLTLGGLKPGEYRLMSRSEIFRLKRSICPSAARGGRDSLANMAKKRRSEAQDEGRPGLTGDRHAK